MQPIMCPNSGTRTVIFFLNKSHIQGFYLLFYKCFSLKQHLESIKQTPESRNVNCSIFRIEK